MNSPTLLRASDYVRTPWKNGLGHTDQIAIHPPGGDLRRGDYLWRISTARIEQGAPFSIFPDHDRALVVLKGAGVVLSHQFEEGEAPEVVELTPLEPYEFPGDIQTRCQLKQGPIQDLSVFIRKGEAQVQMQTLEISSEEPFHWEPQNETPSLSCFVFVVEGSLQMQSQEAQLEIHSGDTLRIDGSHTSAFELHAKTTRALAVLIQIDHA